VARYTRHQLKEDKFAVAVQERVVWGVEHRKLLTIIGAVAAAVAVLVVAGFFYLQTRDDQASVALSGALRTYTAPLRPLAVPPQPGLQSFTSAKERAQAAQKEFRTVEQQYRFTRSADFARYWVGVTAMDMGDYKTAEQELRSLTGSRRDDLAPLAKFALASVYRAQGKDSDAIQLYKELIDHPSVTVPKSTAQIELASVYEFLQPAEAARIYQQIRTEAPTSAAAQVAGERLQTKRQ